MDYHLNEAELSRAIIDRSEKCLVVADHSKFGRRGVVRVCGFERIATLISDRAPPPEFNRMMAAAGTEIMVAGANA